jgi:L-ribulokinase
MGKGFDAEYHPKPENVKKYKVLYEKYSKIGSFIETIS